MTVRISCLTPDAAAQAAAVERACLETAWSESQLRSLPPESVYLTAKDETETVCGIASANLLGEEAELLNLAVLPAYRRNHVARMLLNEFFSIASGHGCRRVFLEVAQTNEPAIELYHRSGFHEIGVRRGFYRGENALVMEKELC